MPVDYFRRVPRDFTEGTSPGVLMSVAWASSTSITSAISGSGISCLKPRRVGRRDKEAAWSTRHKCLRPRQAQGSSRSQR